MEKLKQIKREGPIRAKKVRIKQWPSLFSKQNKREGPTRARKGSIKQGPSLLSMHQSSHCYGPESVIPEMLFSALPHPEDSFRVSY